MKKLLQKGFTFVELLIVLGILAILIATVLLVINPAEAQRKARDAQRMKDLVTMQAIMDQAVSDGVFTVTAAWDSSQQAGSKACDGTGWLGFGQDFCKYIAVLPRDPQNVVSGKIAGVEGTGTACSNATTIDSKTLYYYAAYDVDSNSYEVNVRQESTSGCKNINNDGGDSNAFVEAGTAEGLDLIGDK